MLQQLLVLAEALGAGVLDKGPKRGLQDLQAGHLGAFVGGGGAFACEQIDTLVGGFQRRSRAGKQSLLEADALQFRLTASFVLTALGEGYVQQRLVGGLFGRTGCLVQTDRLAFLEIRRDLVADVLLEPADHQSLCR